MHTTYKISLDELCNKLKSGRHFPSTIIMKVDERSCSTPGRVSVVYRLRRGSRRAKRTYLFWNSVFVVYTLLAHVCIHLWWQVMDLVRVLNRSVWTSERIIIFSGKPCILWLITSRNCAQYVCIPVFTLDAGLLARSQYSEGPATGHLDTGFSLFPLSISRCWDGSQYSKLPLHASYVALQT